MTLANKQNGITELRKQNSSLNYGKIYIWDYNEEAIMIYNL